MMISKIHIKECLIKFDVINLTWWRLFNLSALESWIQTIKNKIKLKMKYVIAFKYASLSFKWILDSHEQENKLLNIINSGDVINRKYIIFYTDRPKNKKKHYY